MRTTTLWAAAALLDTAAPALAKNTPKENNPNLDAPFVRNPRADRPGQTVTAQVLRAGKQVSGWKPTYASDSRALPWPA